MSSCYKETLFWNHDVANHIKTDKTKVLPLTTGMVKIWQNSKLNELKKEQNPPRKVGWKG